MELGKNIFKISNLTNVGVNIIKIKELLDLVKIYRYKKFLISVIITIIFLFPGTFFVTSSDQIVDQNISQNTIFEGQILFAPIDSTTTYLIDNTGKVNHTWSSSYLPGQMVYWLGNGTILRTIRVGLGPGSGGAGGGVQIVEWDGTVVWDFRYNTNGVLSHHDVKMLSNGNVLLIAWEIKTRAETIAAGRNPNYVSNNGLYPDHIIEVKPTGPTSGTIVWEWHVWDHLIQDYDSSKANYGVVADHPELADINYPASSKDADWMHTNSIDYNEEFDQILLSVHNFNEIWVIDHSTTTTEAASHTGGNSGKGGDLLYRWGNPVVYGAGTTKDQKLFNQHDASWIKEGYFGAGNILIFNNQAGNSSHYSSIDEIVPPVNENGEYYLEPALSYGPSEQTWRYIASPPTSFFSGHLSGAERLPNGDTLICSGEQGVFFEVTSTGTTLWAYKNFYPIGAGNNVFKIDYIPSDDELPNQPPYIPSNPNPLNGTTGVSINVNLSWTGGDPNSDDSVYYDVYFGTSITPSEVSTDQSSNSYNSGTLINGITYFWRIVAWDSNGFSTAGPLWHFTTLFEGNNPPNKPVITGETNGKKGQEYLYTTSTSDPDGDQLYYNWSWGDGTYTGWIGVYDSGEIVSQSHSWSKKGDYSIKVQAKDISGAESDWSIPLEVNMPKAYIYNPLMQLILKLLERFPFFEKILN